jgi:hypothetical protein
MEGTRIQEGTGTFFSPRGIKPRETTFKFEYLVELLYFSHFHHVSLVQWANRWLPDSSSHPGGATVQPTLWNWDYELSPSRYSYTVVTLM